MKGKKLLAGILSAAMMLGSMVMPAFADDAAAEPITEISTVDEFVEFADNVNSGVTYKGKTVTLSADIDLDGIKWTPIGIKSGTKFEGTFDGQNHTIENLLVAQANGYGNGLFANTVGATIKNFTIDGASVYSYRKTYYGNVYGIVAGYSYGTATFENISVINSEIYGYGKVSAILGMAARPGKSVTTIKDCYVADTEIYGVYDVAPFIGLSQNVVEFENNTTENVTWVPDSREKYVEINDSFEKDGELYNVRGLRWLYREYDKDAQEYKSYLYNGYADYYTDFFLGYNPFSLTYNDQYILCDGLTHNEYEAKIGNTLYDDVADAFSEAKAGDVVITRYFTANEYDTKNLAEGLVGSISKNECKIYDYNETLSNDNSSDEDKLAAVNAKDYTSADDETVKKALETLKEFPSDTKEKVDSEKLSALIDKTASAITAYDNTEDPTITAKSVASGVELLTVTKLDESNDLQQPDSVKARYFDVKLFDGENNIIKEVDVPVLVLISVDNASEVEKVLRHHDGVTTEIEFSAINATTIGVSVSKFSEFAVILNQDIASNQAVLGFEETPATEEYTAKYRLYLASENYTTISNFEAGEFAFTMTGESSAEFTAEDNLEISFEPTADKYRINRSADGADNRPRLTDKNGMYYIYLATLTVTGVGSGSFDVSDIQMYKKSGDGENIAIDIDALASSTTIYEIKPATHQLVINVTYPNNITNNATGYQDMAVTVKGADFDESYKLGSDASSNVVWNNDENTYTVTIADKLAENTSYTVTVSGAGYRTARYTVMLNGDKTLNFWNNAKDAALEVEEGNANSKKNVTFLAGDIVKDNSINIYDLSAVVSYFGTDNLISDHPEYAKYDLNRDGKIDSKDVAYVLVSWGK